MTPWWAYSFYSKVQQYSLWEGKETFGDNFKVLYLVGDYEVRSNLASNSNSVISYLLRQSYFMALDLEAS